ncbi:hypothetical protein ACHWQZ_G000922 [Mnemiopsis leidyi]
MHEQWTPLLALDPPHQQSQVKMQQNALKLPEPAVQVQVDPGSPSPNKPVQKDPMAMPTSLPSRVPPSRTPSSPLPGSRRISRSAARQLTPQDALYSSLLRSQGSRTPSPSLRPPSTPLTEDGAEGVIDVNQYRSIVHGSRRSRNSVYSIDPSLLERPGRIREINSMEEFKERLDQAKEALVCVTFSAKWCGPWRMIKPDVHRLSHIHGDVEFYEIDVDDNEEIAEARRVACMPTFQFFKRGIMLDKFAEPNRIKLDETIRKLRKMEIRPEE